MKEYLLWEVTCADTGSTATVGSGLTSFAAPWTWPVLPSLTSEWSPFSETNSQIRHKAIMNIHLLFNTLFSPVLSEMQATSSPGIEKRFYFVDLISTYLVAFPKSFRAASTTRDSSSFYRRSSWVSAYACSAPGDVCYHLMKYIFRMPNMHINYPIDGSDFLRAIPFHCLKNIFENSGDK